MLKFAKLSAGFFDDTVDLTPTVIDKFGRNRVSLPYTVWDSKQLADNRALFWADAEVSGSGTGSSYNANTSATTISVSDATAGKRVRQTRFRHNYQPGKSQRVVMTGVLGDSTAGITKEIGLADDRNGLLFRQTGDGMSVVLRSYVTGAAVETVTAQDSWNIDKLDGTGISGATIDFTKATIFVIDFEWLGVGDIWFGVFSSGALYYCHVISNANALEEVYMTTPNLPCRYSIENDGTGGAASLKHICTTVQSEGGQEATGIERYISTNGTHVDANAADTTYAVVGIRLKSTHIDNVVKVVGVSMFSETNDNFEWLLIYGPTVAGTFTYADLTNSPVQYATGATANTVTGGTVIAGGWSGASSAVASVLSGLVSIGSEVDRTSNEIVLCVRPLSNQADIQGSITWTELA